MKHRPAILMAVVVAAVAVYSVGKSAHNKKVFAAQKALGHNCFVAKDDCAIHRRRQAQASGRIPQVDLYWRTHNTKRA